MVKKICLTAAPGPSVVINWNTSLEYAPSFLLSLHNFFSLHTLAAWLFPLRYLHLDVFFPLFFRHPFFPPPTPFSLSYLNSSSNEQLWMCTLLLRACLSSLEKRRRRRKRRRRWRRRLKWWYRRREGETGKSGGQTDAQNNNDQDAEIEEEGVQLCFTVLRDCWFSFNAATNIRRRTFRETSAGHLLVNDIHNDNIYLHKLFLFLPFFQKRQHPY